jgi:DNA-binding NarL/FixJ family response regulator
MRSETSRATSARPGVAIVDIDRRVRAALADALRVAGLEVVGTAGESVGALGLVEQGAQVLVLDPRLPELSDGHALVEQLANDFPDVRVVIMGWTDTGDSRLTAAAAAFVAKSATPEEFVAATMAACGY